MSDVVQLLIKEFGVDAVIGSSQVAERATSYWDSSPTKAKALLRLTSTEQVSRAMQICSQEKQTVVVQGGLTGVVGAAVSTSDDIIISLEGMNQIESVDAMDGVAVIQAGAILQTVQEQLAEQGFLFPLDLGARGSCTIGGTVATNAGGINVLRYGMMRNLVLGLEAVLADGTVISSMHQMLKNNTGYDLKQLFIGSEGTLGIVTRVVVKLFPAPKSRQTAMIACESFDAVVRVLKTMQTGLAGTLSAFEVMWNTYYSSVTNEGGHRPPMDRDYPFYVLAEAAGADQKQAGDCFQRRL
jgi:FAD/FMN-containing dehydrogenase